MTTVESERRERWSDEAVDQLLGNLLRFGVIVATIVAAIGGVLYLAQHGTEPTGHGVFHGEPAELRHVGSIVRGAFSLHAVAILQLGLVLLIATPVARVAMSLVAFILQRDRVYIVVTSIVLALLIYSLTGGVAG
ncbi:MAG TPA: DUF1634 domain-containing protein [Gemmatimonadaceae bacterium]|nr:DUF1634 domain-containing protein [Gemmatimonadaceae bacterium]